MKKITTLFLLILWIGLPLILTSCGSRVGGGVVYRHHHGYGPWWGSRGYYRDRVIVVPDREPELEATPLPSGPEMMPEIPDMGMPDMGGDFGGDMGGDW